jgi:hypothetical protein
MSSSGMLRPVALLRTDFVFLRSLRRLLVTANVVPSSLILVPLMMEALDFSETSVLTRVKRRNIPEDDLLHPYFCLPTTITLTFCLTYYLTVKMKAKYPSEISIDFQHTARWYGGTW